jgi:hypothetical protein
LYKKLGTHNFYLAKSFKSKSVLLKSVKPMKLRFLLSLLLSFCGWSIAQAQQAMPLGEALAQKYVELRAQGNAASTHYLRPLRLYLKNTGKKPLKIQITPGMQFVSQDPGVQDLIITRHQEVLISGKASVQVLAYAMCIQASKSAPSDKDFYQPYQDEAPPQNNHEALAALAHYIDEQGYHKHSEAQHALWAVSDAHTLESIDGLANGGDIAQQLRIRTAELTGQPLPQTAPGSHRPFEVALNEQTQISFSQPPQRKISGQLRYQLGATSVVQLVMFDEEGRLVREIYHNPESKRGEHRLQFAFDASEYTLPRYEVKLLIDAEVVAVVNVRTR